MLAIEPSVLYLLGDPQYPVVVWHSNAMTRRHPRPGCTFVPSRPYPRSYLGIVLPNPSASVMCTTLTVTETSSRPSSRLVTVLVRLAAIATTLDPVL